MLYAIEVPPPGSGGDTLFANAKLAYRSLPEELRSRLGGLKVRHQKDFISRLSKDDPAPAAGNAELQATRPLALEHPVTRERLLYLCRRYNPSILSIPKDESDALVSDLLERLERPENVYRHVWQPGDVIVWDNITLLHARTDFDPKQARHLRRVIFKALPERSGGWSLPLGFVGGSALALELAYEGRPLSPGFGVPAGRKDLAALGCGPLDRLAAELHEFAISGECGDLVAARVRRASPSS